MSYDSGKYIVQLTHRLILDKLQLLPVTVPNNHPVSEHWTPSLLNQRRHKGFFLPRSLSCRYSLLQRSFLLSDPHPPKSLLRLFFFLSVLLYCRPKEGGSNNKRDHVAEKNQRCPCLFCCWTPRPQKWLRCCGGCQNDTKKF